MAFWGRLDRFIGRIVDAAAWLALPLIVLLFLQWPLRDLVRAYAREANDLGQWIFAIYVALSITAATRAGTHLAADLLARGYSERTRLRVHRAGAALALVPWALFIIIAGRSLVLSSLGVLETFPDTANPGYFLIKLALWLMAAVVLAQAAVDLAQPLRKRGH